MSESYHTEQPPLFPLTRICLTCDKEKSLERDFDRQKSGKHGYRAHCKKCRWDAEKAKERQEWVEVPSKICPKCDPPTEKPINEFAKDKRRKNGHASYCKECMSKRCKSEDGKARDREYRKIRRRDPILNKARQEGLNRWRHGHPESQQELTMRRNARKKAATTEPVSYKRVLAQYGYHCYICDQPIDPDAIKRSQGSLTFDHILPLQPLPGNPQGAHSESNLRPAHKVCNARKGRKPLEALTPFDRSGL